MLPLTSTSSASRHSAAVSPSAHTPLTTSVRHCHAAPSASLRDRFVCPECGKKFLCRANLQQHRTARHGVHVATPEEQALAVLAAQNAQLEDELTTVRARVKRLKEEGKSTPSSSSSPSAVSDPALTKTYPSAVQTGQLMEVDAEVLREWRHTGRALGTGISFVNCVGTVVEAAQVGHLAGCVASAGAKAAVPRVLQFTVQAHGYRERRPGQLKMYRAQMLVRYIPSQPYHNYHHQQHSPPQHSLSGISHADSGLFKVQVGDVVRVQGHYALHNSYDMVSKQAVENVVVEADFVGLLRRATATTSATAAASVVACQTPVKPAKEEVVRTSPPAAAAAAGKVSITNFDAQVTATAQTLPSPSPAAGQDGGAARADEESSPKNTTAVKRKKGRKHHGGSARVPPQRRKLGKKT